MIFICVGSREYQFNRLLVEIDELIDRGIISDKVFAQIGKSTYIPMHYEYTRFLTSEEFDNYQDRAKLIISHGGTGALIGALKKGKQVIAVPRLAKFDEHIDDHQIEVAGVLEEEGYLRCVLDIKQLGIAIQESYANPLKKKYNKKSNVIELITDYINNN